ncbi:hypothetical protein BCU32_019435 [Vibrio lentus]|uniref:hypothetical protein n=1 Tax=Vibrio lentus TaxID=136468 RepID=UPI0039A5D4B1
MQKKDDKKQVSPVLSQFEETAVISDSAQVTPVLVYGKRHIKKEKLAEFKRKRPMNPRGDVVNV